MARWSLATSLDSDVNCTKRYDAERSHKRLTHTGFSPTRVRDKSLCNVYSLQMLICHSKASPPSQERGGVDRRRRYEY